MSDICKYCNMPGADTQFGEHRACINEFKHRYNTSECVRCKARLPQRGDMICNECKGRPAQYSGYPGGVA